MVLVLSLLFEIEPYDPVSFVAAFVLLFIVAFLASILKQKKNMRIAPTLALLGVSIPLNAYSQRDETLPHATLKEIHQNKEVPDPAPRSKKIQTSEKVDELETFVLKPVKVKSDEEYFRFADEKKQIMDEPFTWKNGGILYEDYEENVTTKIGFQYDAQNNAIRLLSFSF